MGKIKNGLKGIVLSSALLAGSSSIYAQTEQTNFTNNAYYQQQLEAEALRQIQQQTIYENKNQQEKVKDKNLDNSGNPGLVFGSFMGLVAAVFLYQYLKDRKSYKK